VNYSSKRILVIVIIHNRWLILNLYAYHSATVVQRDLNLTPERLRFGPRERMTSSVRSDCSASHTKPMVTISGQFISTRRIFILCPQLLCNAQDKITNYRSNYTEQNVKQRHADAV